MEAFPGITKGGDRLIIGIDAHKVSESVCVTDNDGKIVEEYRMDNTEKEWNKMKWNGEKIRGTI